jgi:hypothetical protein
MLAHNESKQDGLLFHPDDRRTRLLKEAAIHCDVAVLRSLLEHGVGPNDQPNGGCSMIEDCFVYLAYAPLNACRGISAIQEKAGHAMDCLRLLLSKGAQWRPADAREIVAMRNHLRNCGPDFTAAAMHTFREHKACSEGIAQRLFS